MSNLQLPLVSMEKLMLHLGPKIKGGYMVINKCGCAICPLAYAIGWQSEIFRHRSECLILRRSFLCGGSTGLFVYGYRFYYYYARSYMFGFLQVSFFFGYVACISYGIFLMLGTIGFRASLIFLRRIYGSIKCE